MSDEPIPEDQSNEETTQSDNWVMPKPVFRTTEGYTPGAAIDGAITDEMETGEAPPVSSQKANRQAAVPDEISTAITEEMPGYKPEDPATAITDEMPRYKPDQAATAITDEMPVYKPKQKGGCLQSFLFMFLVIVVAVAGIVLGLYYYFTVYTTAGSDPL